jgi:hypothetical protein
MKVGLNGKKDMDSIVSTGKLYGCNRAAITDNTKILLALLLTAGANGFHMTDIDPFALGHEGVGTGCSAAHGRGEAVDLGVTLTYDSMPGVEWRGANFYTNQEVPIAFVKLIAQIAEEKGLGSIGVAQFGAGNTCGVTDTPDARYANGFSDSCNHIHLQVTN